MTTNNHPAHGPVSLDRLHQISETLSKAAAQSDGGNLGYAMADAVKVIDGAIAAFGAEPAPVDIEMLATVLRNAPLAPSDSQGKPRAPVVPDDGREQFEAWMLEKWGRERQEYDFVMGKFLHGENYADSYTRHMWKAWSASRAAMLQAGNSPAAPDGWVMVPKKLTAENGAKGVLSGEFSETKFINCPECFGDDDCETCDGSGRIEITVPVTWTTIKAIWAKGVEHFAAAPQQEVK